MTAVRIGVIDYGVGNLKSVANALAEVGATACVSSERSELAQCDRLILPGVGAFPRGMQALAAAGLTEFLLAEVDRGRPLLGICLGMQMLCEYSSEFGKTPGLGIIPGGVSELRRADTGASNETFRLPNVGWLPIERRPAAGSNSTLLEGVPLDSRFYFIHSYAADEHNVATSAVSEYCGVRFAAMVSHGSVHGTQFHPEKSGPEGLKILKNFATKEH